MACPRLALLLQLGAELRLGQVVRMRRSDLDLIRGAFAVAPCGRKRGTRVVMTPGQQFAVRVALNGYLAALEADYLRSGVDYPLFPGGRIPNSGMCRVGNTPPCCARVPFQWLHRAEQLAEIAHIPGRCAYGMRRAGTDAALDQGVSLEALQEHGGWTNSATPLEKYRDRRRLKGAQDAAAARAKYRGEVETA